jgi:transcriptional regulator with XRE-family HTH domain
MDLGHRVRDLRNAQHLSQIELAARAGVARNTLNRIENGHLMPTAPVIEHLAEALNVAPGALFEEPALAGELEDGPSLQQLHRDAKCATDWLVKSQEEWRAAWEKISSPGEAVRAVFDLGDEYSAVRKRIAERDPALALPHRLLSGQYKQAFDRWIFGMQNAHSCGVAAGRIGVADTLNDLVKEVGLEDEMRRREVIRKARGAEPLEGMQLAS